MLAACGTVHPGDAAVVDGQSISMSTLEDTAGAYCLFTLNSAQQQGIKAISNTDIRRQAVVSLVSTTVARSLAKSEGLDIKPVTYELGEAEEDQLAEVFPDADQEKMRKALQESREVSAIAIALAAKQTGQVPDQENQASLEELGRAAIMKEFKPNDVKFAPRFGLSPDGAERSATGSLSVAPVDLEAPAPEELPKTQRCS
ncbi:hypothetical protein [Aeromicrobium sp. UC242_57]|uniref:hypothetical protein n=1 Tax=Aeromicrobium sp. UC242_57 TaxID=3374624 RepID=UPI00379E1A72